MKQALKTPRTAKAHEGRADRYLGGTVDYQFAAQLERELNQLRWELLIEKGFLNDARRMEQEGLV